MQNTQCPQLPSASALSVSGSPQQCSQPGGTRLESLLGKGRQILKGTTWLAEGRGDGEGSAAIQSIPSMRRAPYTDQHSCCPSLEPCFQLLHAWSQSMHQRPAHKPNSTAAVYPQQHNKACTAVTTRMLQLQPIMHGMHSPAESCKTSLHLHLHAGNIAGPAAPLHAPAARVWERAGAEHRFDRLLSSATFFVPQVPPAISTGAFQIPPLMCASSLKKTRRYFIKCSSMVRLIKLVWHTGVFNTIPRLLAKPARARSPNQNGGMQPVLQAVAQATSHKVGSQHCLPNHTRVTPPVSVITMQMCLTDWPRNLPLNLH